ncbi:hypothetical protein PG994_009877 [Apiospora phragmitis]|uniref:Uncharacterized protein n=1 Tax=Apiospora phragmitis TaxID=2905665 RepID=A0ABR1TNJ8_9PEZI
MGWIELMVSAPGSRRVLVGPTTILKRVAVLWLLFAPPIAALLLVFSIPACAIFSFVTSLFDIYWSLQLYIFKRPLHQLDQDVRPIARELGRLYALWWYPSLLAENVIAVTIIPWGLKNREDAILTVKTRQQAYADELRQLHNSRFSSSSLNAKSSTSDASSAV